MFSKIKALLSGFPYVIVPQQEHASLIECNVNTWDALIAFQKQHNQFKSFVQGQAPEVFAKWEGGNNDQ